MFRTLLTSTALAALLTAGAIAQDATTTPAAPADTNTTAPAAPADTTTPAAPADATTPAAPADTTTPAAPAATTKPAAPADTTTMAPAAPADTTTMDATPGTSTTPMTMANGYTQAPDDSLASRIIGQDIWSTAGDDAEKIGSVNDLVVGANGMIDAVIVGVGGFLGIGEKNVAVDFSELDWTQATDGSMRWVLPTTAEALTAAPDFVWAEPDMAANGTMTPAADGAMAPATPTTSEVDNANAMGTDAPDAMAGTAVDRSTLTELDPTTLTAEQLIGVAVYGPEDTQLAKVGDFLMSADGKGVDAVIVDFGGFLGLGVKEIAVGLDNADFATDANGNTYLFLNATREQLDAAPAFNRDTYATDRANQRFVTTK